jgi:hypothetical protein
LVVQARHWCGPGCFLASAGFLTCFEAEQYSFSGLGGEDLISEVSCIIVLAKILGETDSGFLALNISNRSCTMWAVYLMNERG